MELFVSSDIEIFDDSFLYSVASKTKKAIKKAKKIVLASGIVLFLLEAPVPTSAMAPATLDVDAVVMTDNGQEKDVSAIPYKEPASSAFLMMSLNDHKGGMMTAEQRDAFCDVADVLGLLPYDNVVCRWSVVHRTVATVLQLENKIELRTTWFADREGKDVVFTLYHDGEEIITSRADVADLVENVKAMVAESKMYV